MTKNTGFKNTEDYWTLLLGGFLLFGTLAIFLAITTTETKEIVRNLEAVISQEKAHPIKTIAALKAEESLAAIKLTNEPAGKFLKKLSASPNGWTNNPLDAFFTNPTGAALPPLDDSKLANAETLAKAAEQLARDQGFADAAANAHAEQLIGQWQSAKKDFKKQQDKRKPGGFSFAYLLGLFVFLGLLFGLGAWKMGTSFSAFWKGFGLVFLLAFVSMFLAGQKDMKDLGIEYAVWAIVLGMLISNTVGSPKWAAGALRTEFYIKTGLIVMGAEVLFNKIMAIGLPGMFVAWVVTPIVLVCTYWFGQNILGIASKSLNITISADMSVCGVSAAVATAAASKATREELTVAIGLSMVFTAIMMILMPVFIKFVGMPEVLGGAWIGGTIDSSGAVVAAGAALGEKAMYVAATIKMIQNVLIGFIAFGVAVYFSSKVEKAAGKPTVGIGEIWRRFPKFILGFIGASLLFTAVHAWMGENLAKAVIEEGVLNGFTKNLRTWLFCLAFASIGLSTNFRELRSHFTGGKPLLLYVCGQAFNLLLTLGMAYLMFYKVFPEVTKGL